MKPIPVPCDVCIIDIRTIRQFPGWDDMPYYEFVWDDENTDHFAQHGVLPAEFEHCVKHPDRHTESWSSGRPACWGTLEDGRRLFCVYEIVDDVRVYPVTAYEVGGDA